MSTDDKGVGSSRSSSSDDKGRKKWGDTTSSDGEDRRIFIGSVSSLTTALDIERRFEKYGKLEGVDVRMGFAFVQFASRIDAQKAVNENGTTINGKTIEVRLFQKRGRDGDRGGGDRNREGGRGGGGRDFRDRDRDRSPIRGRGRDRGSPEPFVEPFAPGFRPIQNQGLPPLPSQGGGPFSGGGPIGMGGGSGHPTPSAGPVAANDVEIIVVSRNQWHYGELIESKIRNFTPIKRVDMLFLHSPEAISMTLNDLFERGTLYALVVAPENEQHNTVTIHILHNQTEFRNVPLERSMGILSEDFRRVRDIPPPSGSLGGGAGGPAFSRDPDFPPSVLGPRNDLAPSRNGATASSGGYATSSSVHQHPGPYGDGQKNASTRLPEEIAYLLRTTLNEGGVQFLSITQIDSVIAYFSRERDRLTGGGTSRSSAATGGVGGGHSLSSGGGVGGSTGGQGPSSVNSILENPQVKQALNSLLNIGVIGGGNQPSSHSGYGDAAAAVANGTTGGYISSSSSVVTRRHPLTGVEVNPPGHGGAISISRGPPPPTGPYGGGGGGKW